MPLPVDTTISCFSAQSDEDWELLLEEHSIQEGVWKVKREEYSFLGGGVCHWMGSGWVDAVRCMRTTARLRGRVPAAAPGCRAGCTRAPLPTETKPPPRTRFQDAVGAGSEEPRPMYLLHGTKSKESLCLERQLRPVVGIPAGWERLAAAELQRIDRMSDEEVLAELELLRRREWW
jgi:hypothetical protein